MKKLRKLFLGIILLFVFCSNVFAEIFDINTVAREFSNSYTIKAMSEFLGPISANVSDGKINLVSEGEVVASFNYTNEYIEYDNRSAVVTEDNYSADIPQTIFVEGIIETLFNLSGYNDKTIEGDENITYEEYGFYVETEAYKFSGTDDGGSWNVEGEYLKYFKVSLNSELISKLAKTYGVDLKEEEKESLFKDATPIVKIGDEVTSSTVWLSAYIEGYEEEKKEETPLCNFYRSTSENGEYELISEWQTPCLGDVSIQDEGLKSGTTYYYKAKIVGSSNYSNSVSVTTLGSDNDGNNGNENGGDDNTTGGDITTGSGSGDNNTKDTNISNPKTGSSFIYLITGLLILSIISFVMMFKELKKYNI